MVTESYQSVQPGGGGPRMATHTQAREDGHLLCCPMLDPCEESLSHARFLSCFGDTEHNERLVPSEPSLSL